MTSAITGEAARSTSGTIMAKATIATATVRWTRTSGEANSTTGSNVIADIDHSGSRSARATTATRAARISGAAKAIRIVRRVTAAAPPAIGHSVSLIAARLGAVASARPIGTAM